jgi:GDP-L-fucose synthase
VHLHGTTVVVTGGAGFLGRHVVNELVSAGADVHSVGTQQYDLKYRKNIDQMLQDLTPTAVVHLAAVVGGIGANQAEPGRFFYENAIMGIELIEACRLAQLPKLVISGTVCAYPKFAPIPFREDDLWNGFPEETNAPYGLAKKMLLVQTQAYRQQYGTNSIFLLPVNLYGPYDNFALASSHVIPSMVRKFVEARKSGQSSVELWGDGSATREFLHVRDAARGFRLALEKYDDAAPVNIGSGDEISIAHLATLIKAEARFEGEVVWDVGKPNGQPRRKLATDRAAEAFGFQAKISFKQGISEVVRYYEGLSERELAGL